MRYALFEHTQRNMGLVNIGDHVQSCAAEQFLPQIDFFVERDGLNRRGLKTAKIIMNGWFTDAPENWPPNPALIPLFVSFHLQPSSAEVILKKQENIDYFKKHEPIGCRDFQTVKTLENAGINAYFSFCLTTTLDINYKSDKKTNEVLFVDPLYSYDARLLLKMSLKEALKKVSLKKLIKLKDYFKPKADLSQFVPEQVINKAIKIDHYVSADQSNEELYKTAKSLLNRYSEAKIVVTSRIHCALPCLAMGTPVLFVLDGLKDEGLHMSRFRGVLDHINILTNDPKDEINKLFGRNMNVFHPNEIDWENPPINPESFKELSDQLKKTCKDFIEKD